MALALWMRATIEDVENVKAEGEGQGGGEPMS